MRARTVARLGPGLVRIYPAEQERGGDAHSIGVMGESAVVTARIAGLLELRPWEEVERLLQDLQAAGAGARVWRVGEPEGLIVVDAP